MTPHPAAGEGRALAAADVGRRIRTLREEAQLRVSDAAEALGLTADVYALVESGRRFIKGGELLALATLLDVRPGAITGHVAAGACAQAPACRGNDPAIDRMRARLVAYLELDHYLTNQGIQQP